VAGTVHGWKTAQALARAAIVAAACMVSTSARGAQLFVTTTADTNDGVCGLTCSVRDAVGAANPGDTVVIPAGVYTLNLGEVTIAVPLTLAGAGATKTILQAGALPGVAGHRLFEITVATGDVSLMDLTVQNGSVRGNGAAGGAIDWQSGSGNLTLTRCRVLFNEANADGPTNGGAASGGALFFGPSGTLSIVETTFADNQVTARGATGLGGGIDGGAIFSFASTTRLVRSTVARNHALATGPIANGAASGGAIFTGPVTVTDSTITDNELVAGAGSGGGIFGGPVDLSSSTVSDNVVNAGAASGGGLFAVGTLRNSIVANNLAKNQPDDCSGAFTSDGYNFISDDTCFASPGTGDQIGTVSMPINPLLGPLANNGGPTQTRALAPRSPAVDGGNPGGCRDGGGTLLLVDERGFPRTADGNGDGTAVCDIGAFELQRQPSAGAPLLDTLGLWSLAAGLVAVGLRRLTHRRARTSPAP
jgi:CSLREA domain-containing protein